MAQSWMAFIVLCLSVTAVLGRGAKFAALEAQQSQASKPVAHKTPMQRVVALLKDMKAQLEAEADKESEMYDQNVCWCQTSEKDKVKAIADADAKDKDLTAEIESRAARFGELGTEIAKLKEQIATDEAALKQATAIREQEASAFRDSEKEAMQAITNLKNAITVLSRHQGGGKSMVQIDAPVLTAVRTVLREATLQYELLRAGRQEADGRLSGTALLAVDATRVDREVLASLDSREAAGSAEELAGGSLPAKFAASELALAAARPAPSGSFMQARGSQPFYKSYAPQSSVIFGLLTQMRDEFEANLSEEQKNEIKAKADFEALSATKTAQISAAKERLDGMEGDHAGNQKALSDAKEDLELVRATRSADVEFLTNLRVTCQGLDKAWEERTKTRGEELKAVSEAIAILTEDDAREHLAKTVSLLQLGAVADGALRARRVSAAAALRASAHSPAFATDDLLAAWSHRSGPAVAAGPRSQLATLAVSVELDGFAKVKEIMDKLIADLKEQMQKEVESKAYCVEELNANEKNTHAKTEEKQDLEAKMGDLAQLIETLQAEIKDAKGQIADTEVEMKKASESREAQNAEFQKTVSDQRATQAILQKALARLAAFYKSALVQKADSTQTPPVQFNAYKKNSGSSPVMGLLEQIINDSKTVEAEAVAAEAQAQANYETFTKESNNVIAQLSLAITDKTKAVTGATVDMEQAKGDHQSAVGELESLADYEGDLHKQCDFLLKNFNIRQHARQQEIDAIQSAKAILSGSDQE